MAQQAKAPYRFVYFRTDSAFEHANSQTANDSLKARALRALQHRTTDGVLCETSQLERAHAVYSILRVPGSKSWMLRLSGRSNT